jgi:hypothetical protein
MCAWAWKKGAPLIGKMDAKQMKSIKERRGVSKPTAFSHSTQHSVA